jgi:HTH-type transcriptional regulator/antitoxin HipB
MNAMTDSTNDSLTHTSLHSSARMDVVRSPSDFGTHLRTARRTRGITQAQAAILAGVGVRLWNEAENGRRAQVGLETVLRMLAVVGVELRVAVRPLNGPDTAAAPHMSREVGTVQDGRVRSAG